MSIDFNRSRFQTYFEILVGISSLEELKVKKTEFKSYRITSEDAEKLKVELEKDAQDYLYTGVMSFSEGIDAIYQGRFSWATVKLYYSVFYLVRATMASRDVGILRNQSMYRLRVRAGETPFNTGNKGYNTTHEGTIRHYKDLFSNDDKLLTNSIDDQDAYEWIQNAREIVNYRSRSFLEPEFLSIWDKFAEAKESGNLNDLLLKIQQDEEYSYCFQEEYAIVGIPIKRLSQTIGDFIRVGYLKQDLLERLEYSKSIISYNERNLEILNEIFC